MLMPKTIHPTSRTLLSYLDGELPVEERHVVAAHLRDCEGCRSELDGIETDLDWHLVLDAASLPSYAPPRAEEMQRLFRSMREWRQSNAGIAAAAAAERKHGVEERVGEAMEVYFGAGAAEATLPADHAEALFSAFLGRRAAATLMKDIRSSVKMERYLAPDMT
jgi:anti-sigma factor RsiW